MRAIKISNTRIKTRFFIIPVIAIISIVILSLLFFNVLTKSRDTLQHIGGYELKHTEEINRLFLDFSQHFIDTFETMRLIQNNADEERVYEYSINYADSVYLLVDRFDALDKVIPIQNNISHELKKDIRDYRDSVIYAMRTASVDLDQAYEAMFKSTKYYNNINKKLGTVLNASFNHTQSQFNILITAYDHNFMIFLSASLLIAIIVFVVINILSRSLTVPLLRLKEEIDNISEKSDYSLAITSDTNDELGDLATLINKLLSKVKQSQEQLVQYTQELESSNRELDDFAHIVSHDLKEPLRGLHNFSQFIMEDYSDKLDDEGRKKLNTIVELTTQLEKILDGLLYYSRLRKTALSVCETNLNETVKGVITTLAISLNEKNTTVEIANTLPTLMCDHVRIAEVFQNLIGNALKYSDNTNNKILIGTTTSHPRYPREMIFYVKDHGIGIEEKFLQAIFTKFKRLHAKNAYGGGTGFGLALVKRIINQHGGDVWAESAGKNMGSTFFFTIPQKK